MYIYIKTEANLWTVGFYSPDGKFHADSDYSSPAEARKIVNYLNGGTQDDTDSRIDDALEERHHNAYGKHK